MKYIPGSAKLELNKVKTYSQRPHYAVFVENIGESYGGAQVVFNFDAVLYDIKEKDILLMAYLNLSPADVYGHWYDCDKHMKKAKCAVLDGMRFFKDSHAMAGHNIPNNDRFGKGWLENYALRKCLLYYSPEKCKICDDIRDIRLKFYDEVGTEFDCEFPKICELFDSEEEFINYVKSLN